MSERYKVVAGSQSAHCCFEYTVVDTTRPVLIAGEHYRDQYETVCETFDDESARLVCRALNATVTKEEGTND